MRAVVQLVKTAARKLKSTASRDCHARRPERPDGEDGCVVAFELRKARAGEALGTIAGMSRSSLHQHFRALTAMIPLQWERPAFCALSSHMAIGKVDG